MTGTRALPLTVAAPNARWSVDFVHDQFAHDRRTRILNVIDDVTKECLAVMVDSSISGRRVASLIERRGKPGLIFSDHGTEFTSSAMLAWSEVADYNWTLWSSALGYLTPAEFAANLTSMGDRLHAIEALRWSPISPSAQLRQRPTRTPAAAG